jgi:hypothetical protein
VRDRKGEHGGLPVLGGLERFGALVEAGVVQPA